MAEARNNREPATYPIETIAKLLELTPRRINQLVNEGVIPRPVNRGRYELVGSVQGYIRFLRAKQISEEMDDEGGSETLHKKRLMKARADIAEMEAERLTGNLVDVASVEHAWTAAGTRFRQKMLAIPHKAAPVLAAEEDIDMCCAMLEEHVHDALRELSNLNVEAEESPIDGTDEEASSVSLSASETDDQPVGR